MEMEELMKEFLNTDLRMEEFLHNELIMGKMGKAWCTKTFPIEEFDINKLGFLNFLYIIEIIEIDGKLHVKLGYSFN